MEEKRHFGRIPFGTEVALIIDGKSHPGALLDISLKGALVRFARPHLLREAGSCLLSLPLAPDIVLNFFADAVHFQEDGVGLKFTSMEARTFAHLVRLLELNTGDAEKVERELHFLANNGKPSS